MKSKRIDAANAVALKDLIGSAVQMAPLRVILELKKLTFIAPRGLDAIVNAKKAFAPALRLDLFTFSGAEDKVFKLIRMYSVFEIYPSLGQVLSDP